MHEDKIREYLQYEQRLSPAQIEDFMREYNYLTDEERSRLIYDMVGRDLYKEYPVDIKTFIHDPYFLGTLYSETIFPIWEQTLQEIYPAPFCKRYNEALLSCATRCFGKGTKVLMFDKSVKNAEDIQVGDKVLGDDFGERTVLSLAHGEEQLYKIIPNGDEKNAVICNAHHILPLYSSDGDYVTETVGELYNRIQNKEDLGKYKYLKQHVSIGIFLRLFTIEKLGTGEFYGFELDKNHMFLLANGYVHHNSGKSTVVIISALYELYLILCAVSPSITFGLKNTANMTFCFLSKDNSTACSQLGEDMHKGLSMAPYFKDTITKNLSFSTLDKKGVQITDNVVLKAGSTVNVITGTDLIFGCLDEANMPSPKIANENLVDSRTKLYTAMVDRRNSTYSNAAGLTGMIWLTSSPMDEGDVIGERINFVQEHGVENVFIMDNVPRWVARNESMEDTFEFYLGSEVQDPCIIEESDVDREILDENRIIEVPRRTDYISQFRGQPRLAIQEIAGRRTLAENAFFPSVSMFQKVFSKENTIFKKDDLRINLDSGMEVSDYLYDPDYFSHPNKPECYRYIHLDMAEKKDRFGLASVYSDMEKYTSEEGEEIRVRKYYIDFCIGVSSSGGKAVDLLKILEFVYGLKKKGYPVKIVTTDSHQGELARQVLRKHGVKTEYQSVEKTKDAYFFLKNLILTGTLSGFKNPLLVKELSGLRETNKRVEKSKTTTDDLSDALAGACFLASQDAGFKSSNEAIYDLLNSGKNMASFNDYQMNSLMVNGSQFDSMDYLAQHLYVPKSNDDYFRNF